MFGRGPARYILFAAILLVVTYYFSRYSTVVPTDHLPLVPIHKDTPDASKPQKVPSIPPSDISGTFTSDTSSSDLSGSPNPIDPVVDPPVTIEDVKKILEEEDVDRKAALAANPALEAHILPHVPKKLPTPLPDGQFLPDHYIYNDIDKVHRTVESVSSGDKKYWIIEFGDNKGSNPNIIPHRTLDNHWYIVSQLQDHSVETSIYFSQNVCTAKFTNGVLRCVKPPTTLPIAATFSNQCHDEINFFRYNVGPHDARVFYGPNQPYVLYGSQSAFNCFGQWVQDFRMLVDWGLSRDHPKLFRAGTEIQRPGKYQRVEKNWFIFWDSDGAMYAHHDIAPTRVFAKLSDDGSVGPDLGPAASAAGDAQCMAKYMPKVAEQLESIHQATNSLTITLCNRSDPTCKPSPKNTFVFTIFHHKSYYSYHSNYEPYIMLFHQQAPFNIHSIAQKPIWINGRALPGKGERPTWIKTVEEWVQTEMFYITSMSWKQRGQKYHGFLDDVLFIAFGIEDQKTAGIDVLAGELFKDLALCEQS